MLSHLHIKNLGIIEELDIPFENGMNIITGETGAGKTLIINAVNMILGSKVSKEIIRSGADKANVEALFFINSRYIWDNLKHLDIEDTEELVISREVYENGKSLARVNGKIVSLSELKKIGEFLIDLHGQYDNQSLLNTKKHINFLDEMALKKHADITNRYCLLYQQRTEFKNKLLSLKETLLEGNSAIDFLKFQINEIETANLQAGEDDKLQEDKRLFSNAKKTVTLLSQTYGNLYEDDQNVCSSVQMAIKNIEAISSLKPQYGGYLNRLYSTYYELEEISKDLKHEIDNIETDPEHLEEVEKRLDEIFSLKKKYGNTIEAILANKEKIYNEYKELLNAEEYLNEIKAKLKITEDEMLKLAGILSCVRKEKATILETLLMKNLEELEMPKARFKINIDFNSEKDFNINGLDTVEFLFTPNLGEELKPLSKIASGGETSRIMLALKIVLADADKVPTMIFDEIDVGISGKAGFAVAEKLLTAAQNKQVISVTHLASIAAKGNNNLYISKVMDDNRTVTKIQKLNENEVINEIARITSGGNITETAIAHAKELRG